MASMRGKQMQFSSSKQIIVKYFLNQRFRNSVA